ncbi:hypothetical protein THOM_2130 [Trachipleistophora hominis]|uniref:Uncharacterized protein n=1 Tax=Trachipleistophora hominis TaxID=72359 RepID=L7JV66_TRAHO|nr:hypothetical protein THOM_2130 [Trachipleistophora hominis]
MHIYRFMKIIDYLLRRDLRTLGNRLLGPLSWLVAKILNYFNRPQSYGEDKDFENDEAGSKMLDDKEMVKSYHFLKNFICSQIRALIELCSAGRKYICHVKAVKSAFDAPITALKDLNKNLIHNFNKLIRSRHDTNRYIVVGTSKKKFDAFDKTYGRLRQIIDSVVNFLRVHENKVGKKSSSKI